MQKEEIFFLVHEKIAAVEEMMIREAGNNDNEVTVRIVKHINDSGGKRLRPLLLILCAKLCGYEGEEDVYYSSVVESIHEATLLHDDVIDESDLRRGVTSANALYGNKIPVLAGDYLYSKSLLLLADAGNIEVLEAVIKAVVLVTDGQILETKKILDAAPTEEDYFKVIKNKTAALIAVCCRIGAMLGDAEQRDTLESVGYALGMAFQLVDDALDYVADQDKLGKKLGDDLEDGNYTLPVIHCVNSATEPERARITAIISSGSVTKEGFEYVLETIKKYKSVEYVMKHAENYVAEAKRKLMLFPESKYREALISIATFITEREH